MNQPTLDERIVLSQKGSTQTVRALLFGSVAAILVPWYASIVPEIVRGYRHASINLLVPLFFSPLWLPAVWAIWKLTEKRDLHRLTSGFSLACSWSLFTGILSLAVLLATTNGDINFGEAIFPFIVICLQIALLPFAIWGYRKARLACNEDAWPLTSIGVGLFATIPFLFIFHNLLGERNPHYAAAAVGSLRTISMAQLEYSNLHPETGFATSLKELGPPETNLIDPTLARSKKAGYIFTLKPGAPDIEGRVTSYAVTAIPVRFREEATPGFFMDETGLIHYTKENRPATTNDPALQ